MSDENGKCLTTAFLLALMNERDKRYEQRFLGQEEALKIAQAREDRFMSKGMGYMLMALTALTAIGAIAAIFYQQ